jgi:hypothetical protein
MAALAKSGLTQQDFSAKVGVAGINLNHWRDLLPKRMPVKKAQFKTIALEPEASASGLCLRAPGGIVLDGLSIASAAELIAALASRSAC